MGFHHLAIATRDLKATHEFYTGPMGFELVRVEVARSGEEGWAKHVFYDTGDGTMFAIWDLHDESLPAEWSPAISEGLGLPPWVNHIAFDAPDLDDLAARRQCWLDHGLHVMEIDHRWCTSIYTTDPNRILVEFCTTTREFDTSDREEAARLLVESAPSLGDPPKEIIHHKPGEGS